MLALLFCISVVHAALSPDQISFAFPNSKTLKGNTQTAQDCFSLTVIGNTTHALFALQVADSGKPKADASFEAGWLGIGAGTTMVGSDDLILFQDTSGWIISRREPSTATLTKMKDPGVPSDAGTDDDFQVIQELSTKAGAKVAQVVFIRKLSPAYTTASSYKNIKMAKSQPFVFARGSQAPSGTGATATISYHDINYGSFQLDLSPSIKASRQFGAGKVLSFTLPKQNVVSGSNAASNATATVQDSVSAANANQTTSTSSAEDPNDTPAFCVNSGGDANAPCQPASMPNNTIVTSSMNSTLPSTVLSPALSAATQQADQISTTSNAASLKPFYALLSLLMVPLLAML